MHENYKASKIGEEKETKDASSVVNVKWYEGLIFGLFPFLSPPFYQNRVLAIQAHFLLIQLLIRH
jgi:hypothetical protein